MITFQRQHLLFKNAPHGDTEVPVQSQLKNIVENGYWLLYSICVLTVQNLGQGPIILHMQSWPC